MCTHCVTRTGCTCARVESAGADTAVHWLRPADSSNIGHKMLQKMGWKEGQGLGATQAANAITTPVQVRGGAGRGAGETRFTSPEAGCVHVALAGKLKGRSGWALRVARSGSHGTLCGSARGPARTLCVAAHAWPRTPSRPHARTRSCPQAGGFKQDNLGLGAGGEGAASASDDPFENYRQRMMLGYKYRPNPLGNPRKQYY